MTPTIRLLLWVLLGGAIGLVAGSIVDAISRDEGWWLVLLLGGLLFGAFYGFWRQPRDRATGQGQPADR